LARYAKGTTVMTSIAMQDGAGNVVTKQVEQADIVILGAGYGGLHVAQRLAHLLRNEHKADGMPWTTLIIDRQPHHRLTTELPRLVNNEVADDSLDIPLDQLLGGQRTQLLQAEIQSIRLSTGAQPGTIETSAGEIAYSQLVIALGSVSNDFGIPGVHEYMRPFLTTQDARDLRLAVTRALEEAARSEREQPATDLEELRQRMSVLIVGAGATGVEVAGAMVELMGEEWERAWRIAGKPDHYRLPKPQIVLITAGPMVLTGWSRQTSQSVADALREMGVDLRLNTRIVRVERGCVQIKGGEWIAAGTLIWAGGVRAPKMLEAAGLPIGAGGRIQVDQFQRVVGRPNIYAVGDSALLLDRITGRPVPPTADIALRSGETAALALAAALQGRKPERVLRPITRNVISVGRRYGAADLLGVKLKGRLALTLKDLIEWEYRQSITRLHGYSAATVV
jgi:NADH:ubiquinone reductase (H+-translocating)